MVILRLMKYAGSPRAELVAHIAQSHKHRQIRIPSGIFLDHVYWDEEKEYCKAIHPANRQINEIIDRFRDSVINAYMIIIKNREPIENITEYVIHQQVDHKLAAAGREKERAIQKVMKAYLDEISTCDYSINKIEVARRTLYLYVRMIGNERVDIALGPDKIAMYLGHLKQGYFGKLSNNHAQNIIRELKMFLLYCKDLGLSNTSQSLEVLGQYRKFFPAVERTKYSLNEEIICALLELEKLYKQEMFCRDVLIFACMTGMRISDVLNVKLRDIHVMTLKDGDTIEYADIYHIKKNRKTMHPINDLASKIITRWAQGDPDRCIFEFYYPMKLNVINATIKKLLKWTGLCDHLVPMNKQVLGREIRSNVPFYEVFSTHSGRVSFSAMFIEGGGNIKTLQAILDHKSIQTTMRYVPDKSKEEAIMSSGMVVKNFIS